MTSSAVARTCSAMEEVDVAAVVLVVVVVVAAAALTTLGSSGVLDFHWDEVGLFGAKMTVKEKE